MKPKNTRVGSGFVGVSISVEPGIAVGCVLLLSNACGSGQGTELPVQMGIYRTDSGVCSKFVSLLS